MSTLTHLGGGVFQWILQTSWQAAVLAGLVLLAQWLLRKRLSPSWRYGLWLLLVVRLLMPVPPQSAFSIFNLARTAPTHDASDGLAPPVDGGRNLMANSISGTAPPSSPGAGDPHFDLALKPPGAASRPAWKMDWFGLALCGWLAGVCFFAARLVWTNGRFRARIGGYQPVADENGTRLFNECRAAFKITQPVTLIESEEVESPAVYGIWRKWLLLPDGVFERFSTEELRCIFLHELAHLNRGDLAVNWLVALLQVLHWFNPVLWLAWARMRADRELATDALALAHVREGDHAPYGETILKVLEGLSDERTLPGLVGIVENKAQLKERLAAISRPGKYWKWAALAAVVLIAAVGLTGAQQIHPTDAGNQHAAEEISGRVVDPDGRPVAGAQLAIFKPESELALTGTPRLFNPQSGHVMGETRLKSLPWNYCTTDAQGRFLLNDLADGSCLLVAQECGFVRIATNEFSTNMTITLQPWGRIEGTLWHYDEAVTNKSVGASPFDDGTHWTHGSGFHSITDDHGRFSFEFVPPGKFAVLGGPGMTETAIVKSGETAVVRIGGSGRPVVGQFKIRNPPVEIEWGKEFDIYLFNTELPRPPGGFKTKEDHEAWRKRPEFERTIAHHHSRPVQCAKDGSFRIEQVDPGKYTMNVIIHDPRPSTKWSMTNFIAEYEGTFEIPAGKPNTREPLDLGVIEISLKQ